MNSVPTQPELSKDLKDLHVGVSMTKIELLKALKRHGVEPFDPTGSAFDPNMHQAMFHVPHPGKEPGSILETTLLGYTLNGRVLRPAQVGVVKDVKSEGEKV